MVERRPMPIPEVVRHGTTRNGNSVKLNVEPFNRSKTSHHAVKNRAAFAISLQENFISPDLQSMKRYLTSLDN
jgi:hypothetical protein